MIKIKTPVLVLSVLLVGCASDNNVSAPTFKQLPDVAYKAPESPPAPARIINVEGTVPETVNTVVESLNGPRFGITHIDRRRGIITARFRAEPDDFLDCGELILVSSQGETRTVPAASRSLRYEVPIEKKKRIGSIDRSLDLDGRLVIHVTPAETGRSDIRVSGDYVLTRKAALKGNAQQTLADETQYLAFGSGQAVGFGTSRNSTICQSNGQLERQALLQDNFGIASSFSDASVDTAYVDAASLPNVNSGTGSQGALANPANAPTGPVPTIPSVKVSRGAVVAAGSSGVQQVRSEFEKLDCAPLTAIEDAEGIRVTGFVGSQQSLDQLKSSIRSLQDVGNVTFQVVVTTASFCEMLQVSLPLHERNSVEAAGASIGVDGSAVVLQEGDKVILQASAPNFDNYVYIIYMQEDGKLLNLVPSRGQANNRRSANEAFSIGNSPDQPSFTVSPPYGDDLVMLVASSEPLFETPRPLIEEGTSFAGELKRSVDAVLSRGGKVVADLVFLRTSPRPS
ncbi:MAG: DUF4384 domain-containing protein [Geminicoccaceae bacterium]